MKNLLLLNGVKKGRITKLTGVNSVNFEDIQSGKNLTQYWISGHNVTTGSSTIDFGTSDVVLTLNEGLEESTLFRVDNGATFGDKEGETSTNTYEFNVKAVGGVGLDIANAGTNVNADGSFIFNIQGDGATGIRVTNNAGRGGKTVFLGKDAQISVSGEGATAALIDGRVYKDGVATTEDTTDTTLVSAAVLCSASSDTCKDDENGKVGEGAYGYKIINQGRLEHQGITDLTNAKGATAIYIKGGTLNNTSDVGVKVGALDAVGVDVYGEKSVIENLGQITALDGIAAVRLNKGASLTIEGNAEGKGLIQGSLTADAIRVNSGAKLYLADAQIKVDGSGSGINFMTAGDTGATETFTLSGSGNIEVAGDKNGAGITVQGEGGSIGNSNFDSRGANGLNISVNEKSGNGIVTNITGFVNSGANVTIKSEDGQSALVVKGNTKDVTQSGTLTSASTAAVVDLSQTDLAGNVTQKFTNSGIISGQGLAVLGHENQTIFTNKGSTANITGTVELQDGDNIVNLEKNSHVDKVVAGHGDNTVKVSDNATVSNIELGNGNNTVSLYGSAQADHIITKNGDDTFELIDVNGASESKKLFQSIDGGKGDNKLVLKATGTTNNVENEPKSHYIFTDTVLKNIADLEIQAGARFELKNSELLDTVNNKDININIVDGGQLFINQNERTDDYSFNNKLTGEGLVTTDLNGTDNKFHFTDSNKAGDFGGTFAIGNGSFDINGNNSAALTTATLRIDEKGLATIKKDRSEKIGGLAFNGGELFVEELLYGQKELSSMLTVDTLNFGAGTGAGKVVVTADDQFNKVIDGLQKDPDQPLESADLLAQDQGEHTIKIVSATSEVSGEAGGVDVELQYQDEDGKIISIDKSKTEQVLDIVQNEQDDVVAKGTYNVKAQTTDGHQGSAKDGLYLSYALTEVELLGVVGNSYSDALNLSVAGKDVNGEVGHHYSDLEAKLTGSGDLVINTGDNVQLSLSNSKNDYTGKTHVLTGDLHLAQTGTLGQTSLLHVVAGQKTVFDDLNDGSINAQTVGQLNITSGAGLELGKSGELTIRGDQTDYEGQSIISGILTGGMNSKIILDQNTLRIEGGNEQYLGDVDVADNAILELNHVAGVGINTGRVNLNGKLYLDGATGQFEKTIKGDGSNEVLINNNSTVAFVSEHMGISNLNIGSKLGIDDVSRVIVTEEKHLAGTDKASSMNVEINKGSTLEFNTNDQHWVVKNSIQGTGDLYKAGSGLVELTQESAKYTGKTTVENGFLIAGRDKDHRLDLASNDGLIIKKSGTFAGYGSVAGDVTNEGTFFVGKLFELPDNLEQAVNDGYKTPELTEGEIPDIQAEPPVTDKDIDRHDYLVKGNLSNSGNIFLSNSFAKNGLLTGTNLRVKGNYISNGGAIFMNTVLNAGHDASSTDKLIVDGDVTVGNGATKLYISNAQGQGAYTDKQPDAIEVVAVGGKSDKNAFILGNRVAIGVYEYSLHKGSGENSESWYLDSFSPTTGVNLNPVIGAFIGNQNAALGMFTMTLHDRMGNLGYTDPTLVGEDNDILNSSWVRIVADRSKYKAIDNKMDIKSNTYLVQLGADFYSWTDEFDATRRLGVMAGYGDIKAKSNTGFEAEGTIDEAYSLGVYGTYYNPNGFYIDGWAQHSWFKNKISVAAQSDNYRSKLVTLSVEVGNTFNISEPTDNGKQWRLQPQAQLTWNNYKVRDKVVSSTGLSVTNLPENTTTTRVGAKLIYANIEQIDSKVQPFVELNWYYSDLNKAIEFNDWYSTSNNAPKNRYELKVGVEGRYNNQWTMWGNIAFQTGKDSYSNYRGTLGVKYDF